MGHRPFEADYQGEKTMKPTVTILFKLCAALGSLSFAFAASAGTPPATIAYGPGSTAVPTMSGTMLIALAVLLALVAIRLLKDRRHFGSNAVIAIAAITALGSGAGGIKLISDADAISTTLDMSSVDGGVITIPAPGFWLVSNSTDVPQTINAIQYREDCGPGMIIFGAPTADDLNGALPENTCATSTTLAPGATETCSLEVVCENGEEEK